MALNQPTAAVTPNTLVDFAYESIRKDITEEYLRASEKINLNQLCERYGISPTPIKQALNRLIVEGLVESIPRKGYRVRRINWREIDELFELRLMMELFFAPQVTQAVASNIIIQEKFEKNLEENTKLVQTYSTPQEYFKTYEMDQQFHELYILSSGNQAAIRTYKNLNTHTYAAYLFGKQPKSKTIEGIQEHQQIYDALRSGDVEEVRRRVALHNENARAKIQLTLKLNSMT